MAAGVENGWGAGFGVRVDVGVGRRGRVVVGKQARRDRRALANVSTCGY